LNKQPTIPLSQEKKLIDNLIANDDLAYKTLVLHYGGKMLAVAHKFFNQDDDANECLQKAFIQVFKNISRFKKHSSLSTWLHRITVNEALMMIRQNRRQNTTSLETYTQHYNTYGERTIYADNAGNNIEMVFEKNEVKTSLHEIIFKLPEKYCNVILLRDIQEISTKETAEILAISESSVKTQLHRARLLLKTILEQKGKDYLENNWKES
jgi:RNA polymerase sigma-70 factor (ECF subfamily)